MTMKTFLPALALAATGGLAAGKSDWDARKVEHLYNRAGFGALPAEIDAGVALGQEALVDQLVDGRAEVEPFFVQRFERPAPDEMREMSQEERQNAQREYREKDRRQLLAYTTWWLDRMAGGEDPLLERMVLFWHGFLTSSIEDVQRGDLLIRQNQLFRRHALGSYAALAEAVMKDPAMLTYLDNQVNRKGNPNENLARELLELFTLGEGNYTEKDVKEAARALTGRGTNAEGEYEFRFRQHDPGTKTFMGQHGRLDGDDLMRIVLSQPACPRFVARKLITWFEGVEPAPERVEAYGAFFYENKYRLKPFLKRLFMDPDFYRPEVVAARVQGPVDYMVGMSRRLGLKTPPAILAAGSSILGQRLFAPPSVKGWDEGEAWITTASLMQRGNLAGMLLGTVTLEEVVSQSGADLDPMGAGTGAEGGDGRMDDGDAKPEGGRRGDERRPPAGTPPAGPRPSGPVYQALRQLQNSGWTPMINLTARLEKHDARTDAEIADRMLDDLLAIDAPHDTRERIRAFLAEERQALGVEDGRLLGAGPEVERVLRRLAHLILSLPEAQLG